jgi:DJ-1/PfpI family
VIVIPAQSGSDAMLEWISKSAKTADLVMSVCTGAFILAKTGLLAGKAATTHHGSYDRFAMQFRDVKLKRGFRFVESEPNLATAGGLTSGIDLALRVYQGEGWKDSTGMTLSSAAPLAVRIQGRYLLFPQRRLQGAVRTLSRRFRRLNKDNQENETYAQIDRRRLSGGCCTYRGGPSTFRRWTSVQ